MPQRTVQQNAADLVRAVSGWKPNWASSQLCWPIRSAATAQAFAIWRSDKASPPPYAVVGCRPWPFRQAGAAALRHERGVRRDRSFPAGGQHAAAAGRRRHARRPGSTQNPPSVGFTVASGIGDLDRLACFVSGQGRTGLERLDGNRIELRIAEESPPAEPISTAPSPPRGPLALVRDHWCRSRDSAAKSRRQWHAAGFSTRSVVAFERRQAAFWRTSTTSGT